MLRFKIDSLKVSFNNITTLDVKSLELSKNCLTVITGRSGSGKTTLLRSLNKLNDCFPHAHTTGTVSCFINNNWYDIYGNVYNRQYPTNMLRRKIGMVFQHPNVLPLSIVNNFVVPLQSGSGLSRSECEERCKMTLEKVGLWSDVKHRLNDHAKTLSGGQQQRLCFARALSLCPEVLLLDEPTSSLDELSSELIETLIAELKKELTIVLVTHNQKQAEKLADKILPINSIHKIT